MYYLPANSFIFNLFLWPAAKDSDTVIFFFFTRAILGPGAITLGPEPAVRDSLRPGGVTANHHAFLHFSTFCSHFTAAIFEFVAIAWDHENGANEIKVALSS